MRGLRGSRRFKSSLLVGIIAILASFASTLFAETVPYTYDSMNRLKQATYESGITILYDYDAMGNMVQRTVVNSLPPVAPVITPPSGGAFNTAGTVNLIGTAEALSTVKVYDSAALLGSTTADASGGWAFTTALLTDGSHSFTATATSSLGVVSTPSALVTTVVDTTAPITTASPAGGAFNTTRSVTLSCTDGAGSGCGTIYYTTDGTPPTPSSNAYSNPISISETTTLKYFAVDLAGNSESAKTATYTLDTTPPTSTASLTGGTYNTPQAVTLTCNDGSGTGCGNIYYSTGATIPTTGWSLYEAPITLYAPTTLHYFAVDLADNSEAVNSQTYDITSCAWTNAAGGNWSTPANWSCGRLPASTEDVYITLNGTYTVTMDVNTTVKSLTLGGSKGLQILSGDNKTLTIDGASTIGARGALNLSYGTIAGTGSIANSGIVNLSTTTIVDTLSLTNNGTLDLIACTVNAPLVNGGRVHVYRTTAINGALTALAGSALRMAGTKSNFNTALTVANGFTNNGVIDLTGSYGYSAALTVTSGTLVNAAGGTINVLASDNTGSRTLTAALNNQGTITINRPLAINKASAAHTNSGTITVNADLTLTQSGTSPSFTSSGAINVNANLTVSQSGTSPSFTSNGIMTIASGKTVSVNGGTYTQGAGATINGAGATLFFSGTTANFQSPVGVSNLTLLSSSATLTSDIDLSSIFLYVSNSTINGAVTITNPAGNTFNLYGSTINTAVVNGGTLNSYSPSAINGTFTTQAGSFLHLESTCGSGNSNLTIANGFSNNGTIDLTNSCNTLSSSLTVASGTLVNAAGGVINSLTGAGSGNRTLTAALNNQGTVTINQPLTINKASAVHANSGTINVNANLTLTQSGTSASFTNSGVMTIASGKTLSITGGTYTQGSGATINGAGATLLFSGTTANFQSPVGVSNLTLLSSSNATLTSDIDLSSIFLYVSNSTINGAVTITNPAGNTFNLYGSTINTAVVNGGTLNSYSTSAINGAFTTQTGSLLHLESTCGSGNSNLTVANGFTNNGTIDLTNNCTTGYNTTLTVTSSTPLVNAVGGVINVLVGSNAGYRYLKATLDNQGTVTVGYPLTMDRASAVHTNSGIISIASGKTLNVSNCTFTNASSGTLSGSGTISFSSATFTNNGTINPGSSLGKLTITGALPQSATSVLNMEIGGTTAGTTYDQLAVSGAATLSGTLNVNLVNGFTPNTGDSFTLMTYGSKTGAFSTVNLPSMGKLWNTTYNPTSLVLSVGDTCPTITLAPSSLSDGTVGTAYSQAITASGGSGSYTYAVTSGSLPSGLSLSTGGVLSGTPTAAGTYAFTTTGTDATTCTGSVQYTMMVQTPCVAPPSGLVSWWQGEGDANDQMSHNTGTLVNGTTFTTGRVGQAFSFDGDNDAVQAGTTGLPTADSDRTMSMWVNITQPVATDTAFAGYGTPGINDQLYMLGATGSGNTLFFSNGGDTLAGPNLQSGRWHHVAVTNSGNLATLYLDGVVVATGTLSLSTPANSAFFIGYLDSDRKLNGAVDEVQMFDRALSATEIAEIYHAGGNGLCDTVAPTVLSTSPAGGATNIAINAPITATLSETMDASTINASSFTVNGGVTGTVTYDAGTKTATFTPSANLSYSTTYTATIIAAVKDLAGNTLAAHQWSFTTAPPPDTTAPTTAASPGTSAFSGTLSVTLTCSDGTGVGCDNTYYTTNGTTPTTSSTVYAGLISITATTTLKFFSTDMAGNSEAVKSATYTQDTTAPTGNISINAAAIYALSPSVTLALTCTDTNGCGQMQFSNDNVTWSTAEAYAASKAWTLAAGDGTRTVYVKFRDTAGNWSTVYSDSIILDANAPVTTASPAGGVYNASKSVTLTCADGTGSGCNKIYYTTNGTIPTTASTAYSKAISITATTTLKYFATDKAGNSEAIKTQTYTIDKTAPTGSVVINAGAASTNNAVATLTLSCTDANGCSQMQFSNNNKTWSTAEAYATTKAWTMTTGTGTKTVYAKFKDTAGNWSTAYNDTISVTATSNLTLRGVSAPSIANITEPVNVAVTMANQGSETSNFTVNMYLSTDTAIATTDTLVGSLVYSGTLATGAQATVNAAIRVPATLAAGTYYIGAIVDPPVTGYTSGYVAESNETNNVLVGNAMTITATSPDLTVTTLSGPASGNINEVVTASAMVKNQGGNTGGFNLYLYLSTDAAIATTDTYLGYGTINSLATGAQATVDVAGKVPSTMTAGNYYVGAIADPPVTGYPSGYVTESNEANNALAGNVMAVTTTAPDLTVVTASGPTGANITEPITVQALVKNQGGSAGGFYVNAYLSTDTTISTGDSLIGSFWYDSTLAAGAQTTVNIAASIPATVAGDNYYLGVIVDPLATGYPSGYVTENDETNNALAGNSVTVTATRADLTVTAVSGPTTGTKGQPIAVSSTIKNQGGTTGVFSIGIYLSTDATITTGDTLIGYMPVTSLAGGASTTVNGSFAIPANLAAGTYYLGAVVDYSGVVVESLEANNVMAGNQITVGP